jgi:hypothetical protein
MQDLEPMEQRDVSRTRPLLPFGSGRRGRILLDWKGQKLLLGSPAQRSRDPWVEESENRLKHPIGGEGVTAVNPENAPVEAEYHRTIGVCKDTIDITKT